ncbi:MAG: phage resistance protein [Actinomycetota bacterium]
MTEPLLAELLDLPTEVHQSDFVVSLANGITDPDRLLREYKVTDDLADSLVAAVRLVASCVDDGRSRATYWHGSFGSGKSHALAVLDLLLTGYPGARAKDDLAPVVKVVDERLAGRKFLLVPYHLIGASSLEAAVLGGYVEHVHRLDPTAPLPAVYVSDGLLENARNLRARMGDDAFLAGLGGGASGWGSLAAGWDASAFEAALAAPHGAPERERLVGAVISAYYQDLPGIARATGEGFVPFDEGLSAISRHAKTLGYDAVILLLDELVLWLASRMADPAFVTREGPKVAKLVESAGGDRPAPIVSFIARQRDLRDLVGEHTPGADKMNFSEILRWWEGRFEVIKLEDRNLPAIIEHRLLQPRSDIARDRIDQAFQATTGKAGERVIETLLTADADLAAFRRVYPFSPALVSALVDLSSALQRERTALRVLSELLANQRDQLRVGDLVPLGDLYDVIAEGDEPFTDEMRDHFDKAKELYRLRLRPLLLATHQISDEDAKELDANHPFRTDDRLVKTLLLAALVPGSGALGGLTVSRLTALNHGTIRSPIPGEERSVVLKKLRDWGRSVGEIRLGGDAADPTVTLQLSGVDTDSIIDKGRVVDTAGERRRKLRQLLFSSFGITDTDSAFPICTWLWRGTRRTVDVVFGNVRDPADVPDSVLAAGDRPKLVIDFPFDEGSRTPRDDLARIETYRAEHPPTRTVCWLPCFLTQRSLSDLGTLVVLDHVLTGERFETYASHLSAVDRNQARTLLDNQAGMLRESLQGVLRQAYGIETASAASVEASLRPEEQLAVLDPTVTLQPPVAVTLEEGLHKVLDQLLGHYFPAHPDFGDEVRPAELRTTLGYVERAARDRLDRIDVEQPHRKTLRRVANPLRLGTMHEAHYTPERFWIDHFAQREADERPAAVTVGDLRRWIDYPRPWGLPREIQDLVICAYVAQTDRVLLRYGAPQAPEIGRLDDAWELHTQQLPTESEWSEAIDRAAKIFGIAVSRLVSAAGAAKLVAELRTKANDARPAVAELDAALRTRLAERAVPPDCERARTTTAARALLDDLVTADEAKVISALAHAPIPSSAEALGATISRAGATTAALRATNWQLVAAATVLGDTRAAQAAALADKVDRVLSSHELAVPLARALDEIERMATQLVTNPPALAPTPPTPAPTEPPKSGLTVVDAGDEHGLDRAQALAVLDELRQRIRDEARLDLSWTITEPAEPSEDR